MPASTSDQIVAWLDRDQPPSDFYELLGVARFDPDAAALTVLNCRALDALRPQQCHTDPQTAQRAVRLQLELARAADLLAHPQKFADFQRLALQRIAAEWQARPDSERADEDTLRAWLRDRQRLHPTAEADAVQACRSRATAPFLFVDDEEVVCVQLTDRAGRSLDFASRPGAVSWTFAPNSPVQRALAQLQAAQGQHKNARQWIPIVAIAAFVVVGLVGMAIWPKTSPNPATSRNAAAPVQHTAAADETHRNLTPKQTPAAENDFRPYNIGSVDRTTSADLIVSGSYELPSTNDRRLLCAVLSMPKRSFLATTEEYAQHRRTASTGAASSREHLAYFRPHDFVLTNAAGHEFASDAFVWNDIASGPFVDETPQIAEIAPGAPIQGEQRLAVLFRMTAEELQHPLTIRWRQSTTVGVPQDSDELPNIASRPGLPLKRLRRQSETVARILASPAEPPATTPPAAPSRAAAGSRDEQATPKFTKLEQATMELLPVKISRQIDAAIVEGLTARLKEKLNASGANNPALSQLFLYVHPPDRLNLRVNFRDYETVYSGDQNSIFDRGKMTFPEPTLGAILKPEFDVPLDGAVLRAEQPILRTNQGWALASTLYIVDVLARGLKISRAAGKDALRARVTAAAGCQLLGKDAEPLATDLLNLLKARPLESDEAVPAIAALAAIGNPEFIKPLMDARPRAAGDLPIQNALKQAIDQLNTVKQAAPLELSPTAIGESDSLLQQNGKSADRLKAAASELSQGKSLEERGNVSAAKERYSKAIKLAPDSAAAKAAQQRLDNLP